VNKLSYEGFNIVGGDINTAKGFFMKKRFNLLVMLVCLLALGFVLVGCPTDSDDGGGGGGGASITIKNRSSEIITKVHIRDTDRDLIEPYTTPIEINGEHTFNVEEEHYLGVYVYTTDLDTYKARWLTWEIMDSSEISNPISSLTLFFKSSGSLSLTE
jgi:hypothetical protein